MSCATLLLWPSIGTRPMLTPVSNRRLPQLKRKPATTWGSFSAISRALGRSQCATSTPNSSPPSRPRVSLARSCDLSSAPSCRSSSSPAVWPLVSFPTLNWSRSRNMSAWRLASTCASSSAWLSLRSKWRRLMRPVSGSWLACPARPGVGAPGPRYVRVDEIADAQHPADAEQQHAQKRHLAVAARHRRHAIERQLHLDGTHQPIHFEHLADRHAGARAAGHRLRARLEGVVAVDARGANGRVGAHIAKRRHALDGLDAPDRLPGDPRLRRGTARRFALCPGPALEIVRQALVVGKVPLAHRPVAEEASALGIGALADELQELHRKRQVAALALVMLGGDGCAFAGQ